MENRKRKGRETKREGMKEIYARHIDRERVQERRVLGGESTCEQDIERSEWTGKKNYKKKNPTEIYIKP